MSSKKLLILLISYYSLPTNAAHFLTSPYPNKPVAEVTDLITMESLYTSSSSDHAAFKEVEPLGRGSLSFVESMSNYNVRVFLAFEDAVKTAIEQIQNGDESLLLAIDAIETAFNNLNHLCKRTAGFNKAKELYADEVILLFWQIQDWVEALVDFVGREREELTKLKQGPMAKQAALQLAAMDDQIVKITRAVKRRLLNPEDLDSPEWSESFSQLRSSLEKIAKISPPNASKLVNGKSVKYNSEEWHKLVDLRPKEAGKPKSFMQNITEPGNWSESTKRVWYSVFVGMQLSQRAIYFANQFDNVTEKTAQNDNETVGQISQEDMKPIDNGNDAIVQMLPSGHIGKGQVHELSQSSYGKVTYDAAQLAKDLESGNEQTGQRLKALVFEGKAFDKAIEFAEFKFSKNEIYAASSMYEAVLSMGHGEEAAIKYLEKLNTQDLNCWDFEPLLYICQAIINQGNNVEFASLYVEKLLYQFEEKKLEERNLSDRDYDGPFKLETNYERYSHVEFLGCLILGALVDQGAAYEIAEGVVKRNIKGAHDLLAHLVRKGQAYETAIKLAEQERYHSIILELIAKGQGYQTAISLALKLEGHSLQREIISALMSQEQYEAVDQIASKMSNKDLAAQINSELWWKRIAQLGQAAWDKLNFWH